MQQRFHRILLFCLCLLGVLLFNPWNDASTFVPLHAAAPTRIQATALPPPTVSPVPTVRPPSIRLPVATLILSVPSTTQPMFSVVQWQDSNGYWNDVDGWRGAVKGGKTIWWVEEKDWGKGPFRWVVYQDQESVDDILGSSEPFFLPTRQGEIKQVSVQI